MDCPRCGSDNVTLSHRRGMEKILRYVYPRVPYRCKECWSRFWKLENPMKSPVWKVAICLIILIIAAIVTVAVMKDRSKPKPARRITVDRTDEKQLPIRNDGVKTKEKSLSASVNKKGSTERIKVPERPVKSKQLPVVASDTKPGKTENEESSQLDDAKKKENLAMVGKSQKPLAPKQEVEKKSSTVDKTPEAHSVSEKKPIAVPQKSTSQPEKKITTVETKAGLPKKPAVSAEIPEQNEIPVEKNTLTASTKPLEIEKQKTSVENFRILRGLQPVASPGEFKLTVTADGTIDEQKVFFLLNDSPDKLVLDFPGKWKNPKRFRKIQADSDIVKQIRIGEHPDKIRLVLDLKVKGSLYQDVKETLNGCILTLKK
jgi:hypothetical protein